MELLHPIRLVYLLAPSYSGSTLLTLLLNTHSQIATVGELKARTGNRRTEIARTCSCGEPLLKCPFWRQVASELERDGGSLLAGRDFGAHFESRRLLVHRALRAGVRGPVFERARRFLLRTLPGARSELTGILLRNRALMAAILRLRKASVFLDSSKDPNRLSFILDSGHWTVDMLHLTRDGRGTASSFMKRAGFGMRRAALQFRRIHEQIDRLAASQGRGVHRVRYEDLALRPRETSEGILRLLGLDGTVDTNFRGVEHHVLGNPMRLESSTDIRLDDSWRRQLSKGDLMVFDRVAGDLNRKLGYLD